MGRRALSTLTINDALTEQAERDPAITVPTLEQYDPRDWFMQNIENRIKRRNLNAIIGYFGLPGSGKSTCSFDLGEEMGKRFATGFDMGNVHFAVRPLMHHVNQRPPRGTILDLDDAETDANSQTWWSDAAYNLGIFGSSGRYRGYILEVSAPFSEQMPKQFKALFHYYFEMKKIDYDHKLVITKPQRPYRDIRGNLRGKYPRATIAGHGLVKVKELAFRLPSFCGGPFSTWPEYETRKDEHMSGIYERMEAGSIKPVRGSRTMKRLIVQIQADHPNWSQADIADLAGVSQPLVSKILARG